MDEEEESEGSQDEEEEEEGMYLRTIFVRTHVVAVWRCTIAFLLPCEQRSHNSMYLVCSHARVRCALLPAMVTQLSHTLACLPAFLRGHVLWPCGDAHRLTAFVRAALSHSMYPCLLASRSQGSDDSYSHGDDDEEGMHAAQV